MDVVPRSVGVVSREWDEQHLALRSAARLILELPGGFPPGVVAAADAFVEEWQRGTRALAQDGEEFADRLRVTILQWVTSDEASAAEILALLRFTGEVR